MQQWLLAPSTMIYLAALDNHRSIVFKSIPFNSGPPTSPLLQLFFSEDLRR